mmetsp:Transcript_6523/g.7280  ORF Transcript_6523/g.7280 Transcript_6523/m.7280 type:complete len:130 (-) Transcript_6523:137-526(-)
MFFEKDNFKIKNVQHNYDSELQMPDKEDIILFRRKMKKKINEVSFKNIYKSYLENRQQRLEYWKDEKDTFPGISTLVKQTKAFVRAHPESVKNLDKINNILVYIFDGMFLHEYKNKDKIILELKDNCSI